ncbi:MAG: hypothetical protein ACTTH5_01945 [Wolinella sp.]
MRLLLAGVVLFGIAYGFKVKCSTFECVQGECSNGYGIAITECLSGASSRFEGLFKKGQPYHGKETLTPKSGNPEEIRIYKEGKKSGEYILRFRNGDVEEGRLVKGKHEGKSVITFAGGDKKEAILTYENGALVGEMIIRYRDGRKERKSAPKAFKR